MDMWVYKHLFTSLKEEQICTDKDVSYDHRIPESTDFANDVLA